jgi:hypothetical protein
MTAWFYVNSNVKDDLSKAELKRQIVENFLKSNNVTDHNRKNVKNMINLLNEKDLKNELAEKIQK